MSKNLKRIIIDVIVTLICVTLITGLFLYEKSKTKTTKYDEENAKSTIVFQLYDETGEMKINDTLNFTDGESIFDILNRNYILEYKENAVGKAVTKVNEYETNFTTCYFAFYVKKVDDEKPVYSNYGTERVKAEDKMEIELIWTEIKLG